MKTRNRKLPRQLRYSPVLELADTVYRRLRSIGIRDVTAATIRDVCKIAYSASLRTEEGRFVRCCVTYADPANPDPDSPANQIGGYPRFTAFAKQLDCSAEQITKIARGIDPWAGSIAVFKNSDDRLKIWGFVDERVMFNLHLNLEPKGFSQPGLFTAVVDGIGQLTVYNNVFFLGGLRHEEVFTEQPSALSTHFITSKILPHCKPLITSIWRNVPTGNTKLATINAFASLWESTIRRLCIGVQRAGTGGAFIITPRVASAMVGGHSCNYNRLTEALALHHVFRLNREHLYKLADAGDKDAMRESIFANRDIDEREIELTGAVRLVSSMATMDGVVVLSPTLAVDSFGSKINSDVQIGNVYDVTSDAEAEGAVSLPRFDYTKYGTRHSSVLRYCKVDRKAIGIIISQDGTVRIATAHRSYMVVYDNIKLREYNVDADLWRTWRNGVRSYARRNVARVGNSSMPQSLHQLTESTHPSRRR